METDNRDIMELLHDWSESRRYINLLEKKCEHYKKIIEGIMNRHGQSEIITPFYNVSKKMRNKEFVSKKNVPENIWRTYMNRTTYPCFHITRTRPIP